MATSQVIVTGRSICEIFAYSLCMSSIQSLPAETPVATSHSSKLAKTWLLTGGMVVLCAAIAKLLIHLYASRHYGYFTDELYYLACGRHLAWGYVDQPPLIAAIAWLGTCCGASRCPRFGSFRRWPGAGKIILTGLIARELGGGRFAQGLAALAVLLAPGFLGMDNLLSMNVFEPLFWLGCAYFVLRIVRTGNQKLWLWVGVLSGLGLLNKHSMLIFGFGTGGGAGVDARAPVLPFPLVLAGRADRAADLSCQI